MTADIIAAFDAMDVNKEGSITLDDLYTIYLGLGFGDDKAKRKTKEELRLLMPRQSAEEITVDVAVKVLSRLEMGGETERKSRQGRVFQSLRSSLAPRLEGDTGLSAKEIHQLSIDANDPISLESSELMIEVANGSNAREISESTFLEFLSSK